MRAKEFIPSTLLILSLLVACNSETTFSTESIPTDTILPATHTPTHTPAKTSTVTPTEEPEEWTYVVLGDSTSWGFPDFYAKYIESDLGINVTVLNRSRSDLSSGRLLEMIREDQELRSEIENATVISYTANPTDHIGLRLSSGYGKHDCSDEALEGYKADLEEIVSEIFALRQGSPTIIRAMDLYCPTYGRWEKREDGMFDEYRRCFDAVNDVIRQVAEENNIPLANVYDVFNGINHDEDPVEKGYILSDGEHTNRTGSQVIADVFRELGYEFITP